LLAVVRDELPLLVEPAGKLAIDLALRFRLGPTEQAASLLHEGLHPQGSLRTPIPQVGLRLGLFNLIA
jgi:hypothetical protein